MDASVRDARPLLALAVVILAAAGTQSAGCANEIESPSPEFTGSVGATSQEEALAYPGFVCSAQRARWVEIHGENFAPLPVGTMNGADPQVNWPEIELTRVQQIDGEEVSGGISVRIQATGDIRRTETDDDRPRDTGLGTGGGEMDATDATDAADAGPDVTDTAAGPGDVGGDGASSDAAGETGTDDTGRADTGADDADIGPGDTGERDTGVHDTGSPRSTGDPRNIIWLDDTTLRFKVTPAMNLKPGLYDIRIISARVPGEIQLASSKTATAEKAFGILPPPAIERVGTGEPICVAQNETQLTLSGRYFLKREDRTPTVTIGDRPFEIDTIDECTEPEGPFGPYEVCERIEVTIPQDGFPASAPNIHVENFGAADCTNRPERDGTRLQFVDPPVVSGIRPDPICSRQTAYQGVTITGQNFIRSRGEDGSMPTVTIGEYTAQNVRLRDCTDAPGQVGCSTIRADIEAGALDGGPDAPVSRHEVSVANPESIQCRAEHTTELTAIAPPTVEEVTPRALVGTQSPTGVAVRGRRFVEIDGKRPTITVSAGDTTHEYVPSTVENCRSAGSPGERGASICEGLEFEIPADDFTIPDGEDQLALEVRIENPAPLSCELSGGAAENLTVLSPPTLTGIETKPICTADQSRRVTLTGSDFAFFDGTGPTVAVGMETYTASAPPESCETVTGEEASTPIENCSEIWIEIPEGDRTPGVHPLTVYNPDPVGGHTTASDIALTVVDRPRISRVEPGLTCIAEGERTLTLHGQNFIRTVEGGMMGEGEMMPTIEVPSVDFEQTSASVTDRRVPDPETNCTEFTVPGNPKTFQRCEVLEVTVEADGESGLSEVSLTNPGSADCSTPRTVGVEISAKPVVTSVQVATQAACDEPGYRRIAVTGDHFLRADGTLPSVTIGSETYEPLEADGCTPVSGIDGDAAYCDELIVYGETADVSGTRSVSVQNPEPSTCSSGSSDFEVTANCP